MSKADLSKCDKMKYKADFEARQTQLQCLHLYNGAGKTDFTELMGASSTHGVYSPRLGHSGVCPY